MWCRICENETTEDICSVCGCSTISENLGSGITTRNFWRVVNLNLNVN